jgi:hypothetical protein
MEAIRQFHEVKNQQIHIELPEDFNANHVEVIIISSEKKPYSVPDDIQKLVLERKEEYFKNSKDFVEFDQILQELRIENEL